MEEDNRENGANNAKRGYKAFLYKRVVIALVGAGVLLWVTAAVLGLVGTPPSLTTVKERSQTPQVSMAPQERESPTTKASETVEPRTRTEPEKSPATRDMPKTPSSEPRSEAVPSEERRPGLLFLEAVIRPLDHELHGRFWGWRPNDILNFTDNVNHYQLGVLEVTRRTAMALAERLSRTGSTASFDPNLERAMNWFMVKAESYWFPSPEGKYAEGLQELEAYVVRLQAGKALFYTRADNLIPLLEAYQDLLGSCDENLVKRTEEDGTPVSTFRADDYFYYAKGVASAMLEILEAAGVDFRLTLAPRHGIETLHDALASLRMAKEMDPWIVTEGRLDGILANHRANMAAPISHARFHLGVLIKTLST